MNCPRCKALLVVVEFHNIELDWCPACEGLWFDSGEMELVTARMRGATAGAVAQRKADTNEGRLRCPECGKTMEKRLLGEASPVIADVCGLCGGLWLDHGELEQVVSQPGDSSVDANPVINHLRGTFHGGAKGHATAPEGDSGDARKE